MAGSDYSPSEDNEEGIKRVYLDALRDGKGPIVAAREINRLASDMDRFIRLDESFALQVQEAVAESIERIEAKVKETAQAGDFQAAKLVLETHKPEQWMKPEREVLLKMDAQSVDIPELHARLTALREAEIQRALDSGEILDVESEEEHD